LVWASLLAAVFVVLVALSCLEGPRFDYNGTWEGHRKLPPGENPYAENTMGTVMLRIRDSRFELTSAGVPTAGSVGYSGDHADLHTDTIMELPITRAGPNAARRHPTITLTPQKDGTLLFADPQAIDGKALALSRQPAKPDSPAPGN